MSYVLERILCVLNLLFKGFKMDSDWLNIMIVLRGKSFGGAEEKCCFTTGMIYLYLYSSLNVIYF
jgi:hypothetical protein